MPAATGTRLDVSRSGDDQLVLGLRIFAHERGTWREVGDSEVTVSSEVDAVYGELIGLGGAVLVSRGSRAEPITLAAEDDGLPLWPFLIGGAVLLVAAASVIIWAVASANGDPRLGSPVVEW